MIDRTPVPDPTSLLDVRSDGIARLWSTREAG